MNSFLLTLMLFVFLVDTTFGLDLSLAPGLSVKNAFLYMIMVVYMIETAIYHNRRFELPSVLVPFGLLIGYCILSWFIASFIIQPAYYKPLDTFISLKVERVDHLIAFLLFFYGVASTKETLSLIRTFLWMMVLGNLLTVVDGFNIPDLGIIHQREDGRLGGPLGESNQYGAFLVLTLPGIIALVWDDHTKKPLAYFACVVTILALMASGSRGSYVGLFLGSAFAAFYLRSFITGRQIALAIMVSILAIVAVIAIFLTTDLFGGLLDRFRHIGLHEPQVFIDRRGRALDHPQCAQKSAREAQSADWEVVDRALRLRRVEGVGGDLHLAHAVFLGSKLFGHQNDSFLLNELVLDRHGRAGLDDSAD